MHMPREREKLHDMLVETLGLSQFAVASLRLAGIITVGDCLDVFERMQSPPTLISMHPEAGQTLFDDVEPRLMELGYLPKNWRDEGVQF